ncbi:CopG family transcriptional regulator [Haloplanus sp. GCM10025708]|uniref:CopG family transcriptional regulator n=1 Tax=Haloferacaceae TaxID=1644056 RepID=UPI00360CEEAA
MAGEQSEAFPDELREWVEEKADALDATPEEVLARAALVYRLLDEEGDVEAAADVDERLTDVDERLARLEDEFDEKLQDVRDRVVQVKREADAKAPEDHGHPELRERVARAVETADDAAAAIEDVEDRLDRGFDNYEEILDYLTETTDELDEKLDALARAVVDVQNATATLEAERRNRAAVAELAQEAHRHGETTANCEDCGRTVRLGLLSRPTCPYCEAKFVELEPGRGFFAAATLVTGDRPALEGDTSEPPETPADLFGEGDDE